MKVEGVLRSPVATGKSGLDGGERNLIFAAALKIANLPLERCYRESNNALVYFLVLAFSALAIVDGMSFVGAVLRKIEEPIASRQRKF